MLDLVGRTWHNVWINIQEYIELIICCTIMRLIWILIVIRLVLLQRVVYLWLIRGWSTLSIPAVARCIVRECWMIRLRWYPLLFVVQSLSFLVVRRAFPAQYCHTMRRYFILQVVRCLLHLVGTRWTRIFISLFFLVQWARIMLRLRWPMLAGSLVSSWWCRLVTA